MRPIHCPEARESKWNGKWMMFWVLCKPDLSLLTLPKATNLIHGRKGMQETEDRCSRSGSAEFGTFPLENHLSTLGFTLKWDSAVK